MAAPVRHRQTKGAETDMPSLPPPRHISTLPYRNYASADLLGKQIIGIVNFAEKKMGPEVSQVLVLGVPNEKGETIFLMPQTDVLLGAKVF
jgi:tRNA-binding protein